MRMKKISSQRELEKSGLEQAQKYMHGFVVDHLTMAVTCAGKPSKSGEHRSPSRLSYMPWNSHFFILCTQIDLIFCKYMNGFDNFF